ncbi:dienelactone hydrolase [Acetobacter estunensis]|uniref:Dienelactone hydrolase n=1 Tax=Acetobacter estunensis TaxID=104097 RepID=A0A967EHL7_9PROT|nr:CocE/NonD family hydrolase [Acetobacter estunensis]NHO53767.1 dienelactone hydrolase [Acetobacter estunensis]
MRRDILHGGAALALGLSIMTPLWAVPPAPVSTHVGTIPGQNAVVDEQVFRLPAADGTILEATLLLPRTPPPHPLAVVSGGATAISRTHRGKRDGYSYLAGYFLARGYAVLRPMLRGFAESEGELIGHGCDFAQTAQDNARDIRAVAEAVAQLPGMDPAHIVTAGMSFGGWTQMAMGTAPLPGTKAQLLFFPLMHSSACRNDNASLLSGAREFGEASSLPTLWVQGDNDSLAPTSLWKSMFAAYHEGNPNARLVDVPPFLNDAHAMLDDPDGLTPWMAQADSLLKSVGLPSQIIMPSYLPLMAPPASGYAALNDISRLPVHSDTLRNGYRKFLQQDLPRAFVVGDNAVSIGGTGHTVDPIGQALSACKKVTTNCHLYAYDNRVVWQGGPVPAYPQPSPEKQTITIPTGKTVSIFYSASDENCVARYIPQIHLVQKPLHGTLMLAASAQGRPHYAQGPLVKCNGTILKGAGMRYRPDTGFHGTDTVVLTKQVSADPHDLPQTLSYSFVSP